MSKKVSAAFFEKKAAKKLLLNWASGGRTGTDEGQKFFASFFQKRSAFFLSFFFAV